MISIRFILIAVFLGIPAVATGEESPFIGTAACAECHPDQHATFSTHSKKAASWKSIEIMLSDLEPAEAEQCYDCHTTGHGKGGFVSIDSTPQFADVGCETCHGPGRAHAQSGDPADITRRPDVKNCETCHNAERVGDFKFKPLLMSGAH